MTETLSPALPPEIDDRTQQLMNRACERDLKLATAESCTGGLIGSLFTDVEGCSHAYDRGFITYSEAAKTDLLGVPADLIEDKGVVSRDVAIAMAEGALANSKADIALSVTGFAGKGSDGDEAGLVHFGCATRDGETRHREEHFGDIGRGETRIACLRTALDMLDEALA